MPPDLCMYGSAFEACKPWLRVHTPQFLPIEKGVVASAKVAVACDAGVVDVGAVAAAGDTALVGAIGGLAIEGGAGVSAAAATPVGEAVVEAPKKVAKAPAVAKVTVEVNERGRKKQITTIGGLEAYCPKLKDAASALGKKFGAGASVAKSVTNPNIMEIDVQVRGRVGDPWETERPCDF